MAVWENLGITVGTQPYGGWSWYLSTAQYTENPIFGPIYANNFPRVRIIVPVGYGGAGATYPNAPEQCAQVWYAYLKSINPQLYTIYGATNNRAGFTPNLYAAYKAYLLAQAVQAQAMGVDLYCIGNENLYSAAHGSSIGMVPTSITRSSNVATAVFSFAHGLTTGDYLRITEGTTASFRIADDTSGGLTTQCTVIDPYTVTYPSTGADESAVGSYKVNWSTYEVIRKTKGLAIACRAVAPNLIYLYSESQGYEGAWITLGITPGVDIDKWGVNAYGDGPGEATTTGYDTWKVIIDNCFAAFGENFILTELNAANDFDGSTYWTIEGLDFRDRGFEQAHAREMGRRLRYVKSIGISQVYYYSTDGASIMYTTGSEWGEYDNSYLSPFGFRPVYNEMREEAKEWLFLGNGSV